MGSNLRARAFNKIDAIGVNEFRCTKNDKRLALEDQTDLAINSLTLGKSYRNDQIPHSIIGSRSTGATMTAAAIRNWLGLYVLILVAFLGGYCFLAPDWLLPLEDGDRIAAFEIILPLLIAQLSAVYRFYTHESKGHGAVGDSVPAWAIKAPLIVVSVLLGVELLLFAVAGVSRQIPPSPGTFKGLVTFCVSLLNASTVLMIGRYFGGKASAAEPAVKRRENLNDE